MSAVAHRGNSRQRSTSVAFGAKRTLTMRVYVFSILSSALHLGRGQPLVRAEYCARGADARGLHLADSSAPRFAERQLCNVDATMTAYSALMLAARITLPHFSVSS